MKRIMRALCSFVGGVTLLSVLIGAVAFLFAGSWLTREDVPSVADAIVVLGGDYRRPLYAADLYNRGYAPTVYIPRVVHSSNEKFAGRYGFTFPAQEQIYHRILLTAGVSPDAIRVYGSELCSTLEEAENMAVRLGSGPGRLIVVTSPYHVRRARMTFQNALPGWTVMVCATPYQSVPAQWWASQESARDVLLEFAKTLYMLMGGGFRAQSAVTG